MLEVRRADQRTIVGGRTYDLTREPPELLAFLDLRGARTELAHASAPPRQETTLALADEIAFFADRRRRDDSTCRCENREPHLLRRT